MQVGSVKNYSVSDSDNSKAQQSFGEGYVTLSRKNLAHVISKNVDAFNKGDFAKTYESSKADAAQVINRATTENPTPNARIKNVNDLVNNVDFFVLAAGSGSRFRLMANAVAILRSKNEKFNKISVPFELSQGQTPLTMLDIPMAMGSPFVGKDGYKTITSDTPTGSFGDIISKYLHTGEEPKDVVVCCGDNVFDIKSKKMLDFIVRTINNPDKQLGVVGVARTPEEVANRFGLLNVGNYNSETGLYSLEGFVEKPELAVAKTLVTPDGNCVANTGMFVIKKEAMQKLLDTLRNVNPMIIAKNEQEKYDFAAATKWTQQEYGAGASDVKIVKTWEDVGEPEAYLRWMEQLKNGHFLDNFSPERRNVILKEIKNRVKANFIQFSIETSSRAEINGINIMA